VKPRERMLAACRGEATDRPPVWLMRQAGRYLPEYRALREKHRFWQMMRETDLALEVSLQPVRRLGVDAAILFSDILIVLDAMGVEVKYVAGGPRIKPLVRDDNDLGRLDEVDAASEFDYVERIIRALCNELHPRTAVIGFAGAPFTLASYLVEKGPARESKHLRHLAKLRPEVYDEILGRITTVVTDLLALQIEAGADIVQLFDTWAGRLSVEEYSELALPWTKKVFEGLAGTGAPRILYTRNSHAHYLQAATARAQVLSIDDSLPLAEARARLGPGMALQGNLDPARLKEGPSRIRSAVKEMIDSAGSAGYIANLGRGLTPDTPVAGVEAFVAAVKEWRS